MRLALFILLTFSQPLLAPTNDALLAAIVAGQNGNSYGGLLGGRLDPCSSGGQLELLNKAQQRDLACGALGASGGMNCLEASWGCGMLPGAGICGQIFGARKQASDYSRYKDLQDDLRDRRSDMDSSRDALQQVQDQAYQDYNAEIEAQRNLTQEMNNATTEMQQFINQTEAGIATLQVGTAQEKAKIKAEIAKIKAEVRKGTSEKFINVIKEHMKAARDAKEACRLRGDGAVLDQRTKRAKKMNPGDGLSNQLRFNSISELAADSTKTRLQRERSIYMAAFKECLASTRYREAINEAEQLRQIQINQLNGDIQDMKEQVSSLQEQMAIMDKGAEVQVQAARKALMANLQAAQQKMELTRNALIQRGQSFSQQQAVVAERIQRAGAMANYDEYQYMNLKYKTENMQRVVDATGASPQAEKELDHLRTQSDKLMDLVQNNAPYDQDRMTEICNQQRNNLGELSDEEAEAVRNIRARK